MDTASAFMMGELNRGRTPKVFDWDKALKILHEHNIQNAEAGLAEDMGYTAGVIIEDGNLVSDSYTYLSSTWATPVIDAEDGTQYECWVYATPKDNPRGYNEHSKWEQRHIEEWNKLKGEQDGN